MLIVMFLVYTAFCFWVVFMDGAEVLEGWKSFFLLGWFAASLTAQELKFYVGISWLAALVMLLVGLLSAA